MRQAAPRPVFVDRTGRRRRIVAVSGVGLAVLLVTSLVVLLAGLSGGSGWHVPGFPDANGVAELTPSSTPRPTTGTAAAATEQASATNVDPSASPSATKSSPRRVPTQTPSHPPHPTKS